MENADRLMSSIFLFGMLFDLELMGNDGDYEHAGPLDRKKSIPQNRHEPSRLFRAYPYKWRQKAQGPLFRRDYGRLHKGAGNKDELPHYAYDPYCH